jgi:hypothetical protein
MLVFIIPIKSKKLSQSWKTVSSLFERCVKSICNQTTNNFQVIVVCNEKPEIEFTHPQITYIERDFPMIDTEWRTKELDRTRKIITGLIHAQTFKQPSHIMFVDADDCVSNRLADFVAGNPQSNGWYFKKGYMYQDGSKNIRIMRKGFHEYCGTSNIIRYDLFDLPTNFDENECLKERADENKYIKNIFDSYRHRDIAGTLAGKGANIAPLPFPGGVYIRNNENIYFGVDDQGRKLSLKSRLLRMKAVLDSRWMTKSLRNEFGLYDIPI